MSFQPEDNMDLEEVEVLTPIQRLVGIYFTPGKVFKSIAVKPNLLLPFIVVGAITLAIYLFNMGAYKEMMIGLMESQYESMNMNVSSDFIEMMTKSMTIITVVLSPVGVIISVLLSALYYWVCDKIFKGKGTYKQYASVMAHVGMITVLATVFSAVTVIITGEYSLIPLTSLGSILPESMKTGFLYGALTVVEVFTIWRLVLLSIALKEISGLKSSKVYIIIGIAFLFGMVVAGISLSMNAGII